jgi:hypothetical protein
MKKIHLAKKQSWTVVTYPQDFSNEGASLGPQTILRLQKIVDIRAQGTVPISSVVLACGLSPDVHRYPFQRKSFALMMKEWLIGEGGINPEIIHCSQNDGVWNCIEVTMEDIRLINVLGLSHNVLVVSTGFHIYPRMWVTWKILCSNNSRWHVKFVPIWGGSYKIFHELGGTVKYIPMALWYRLIRKV